MRQMKRDCSPIDDFNAGGNYGLEVMRLRAEVRRLRRELEISVTCVNQLLAPRLQPELPKQLQLTPLEDRFVRILMLGGSLSRDALFAALYADVDPDWQPEPKILMVLASRIRRRLAPFGVTVLGGRGEGYGFAPEDVLTLLAICDQAAAMSAPQ